METQSQLAQFKMSTELANQRRAEAERRQEVGESRNEATLKVLQAQSESTKVVSEVSHIWVKVAY